MSYTNAIEACRAELFTKKVELCDRYPQALVDYRFSALLAKKSVTAASSKSMTLKYFGDSRPKCKILVEKNSFSTLLLEGDAQAAGAA